MTEALHNKQILLGVSGGIAAYKSAELARLLKGAGAQVRVVMTAAAQQFVTPLTFQALSGNPVRTDLLDADAEAGMGHIELARWADLVLIAPASADLIARLAQGHANDLLTTLCLATAAPIALAPAMNQGMWRSPATQRNLELLRQDNRLIFDPAEGEQACGDIGPGRMLEPSDLMQSVAQQFGSRQLAGKNLVITAGPTREALDPVRYLSNRSSGKMGFALAEAALAAGAQVTLISGPVNLRAPTRAKLVPVQSAQEMYDAALAAAVGCDIFIGAAAVADYAPVSAAKQKIKKQGASGLSLELKPTLDIVAAVAKLKPKPYTAGFAAESEQLLVNARRKLEQKQLDLVIANDISRTDSGFDSDYNAITLVSPQGELVIERMPKSLLAPKLIEIISHNLSSL